MHNNQCRGLGIGWPLLSIFTNLSFRVDREKNPNGNGLSAGEGLKNFTTHRMFESTFTLQPAKDFYPCNRTLFSKNNRNGV